MKHGLTMRRTEAGLEADDREATEAMARIKPGDRVLIRVVRPRSLDQHRLFFAVLARVAEATRWETPERLLTAIKLDLGRYDLMKMRGGKVVPVIQSISFAAMDQTEFQQFFDQAIQVICEKVLPGTDPLALLDDARAAIGMRSAA